MFKITRTIVKSFSIYKPNYHFKIQGHAFSTSIIKDKIPEVFDYIHGSSSDREANRLYKQAERAEKFLWKNIDLGKYLHNKSKPFFEIGCGVGAQTPHILQRIPQNIKLIGIDIDEGQIIRAKDHLSKFKEFKDRYSFDVMDISTVSLEKQSLSGAYICWVLEHLKYSQALTLMTKLKGAVQSGGVVVINEIIMQPGEGVIMKTPTSLFPPQTNKAFEKLLEAQKSQGGNPNIGNPEYLKNLLKDADISSYKYEKLSMSYTSPEDVIESRRGTLEIIESAIPYLSNAEINLREIEHELLGVTEFHYSFGQCIVEF
jgi:ubiquinone/menaquinone biosynthesis C-methylase UbiE